MLGTTAHENLMITQTSSSYAVLTSQPMDCYACFGGKMKPKQDFYIKVVCCICSSQTLLIYNLSYQCTWNVWFYLKIKVFKEIYYKSAFPPNLFQCSSPCECPDHAYPCSTEWPTIACMVSFTLMPQTDKMFIPLLKRKVHRRSIYIY